MRNSKHRLSTDGTFTLANKDTVFSCCLRLAPFLIGENLRSGGEIRARAAVKRNISIDVIGWRRYIYGLDSVYSDIRAPLVTVHLSRISYSYTSAMWLAR